MEGIIYEQIHCERADKGYDVKLELKNGKIVWAGCKYMDKEKNIGRCSKTQVLCDVFLGFEQWTLLIDSVCSFNGITLPLP